MKYLAVIQLLGVSVVTVVLIFSYYGLLSALDCKSKNSITEEYVWKVTKGCVKRAR